MVDKALKNKWVNKEVNFTVTPHGRVKNMILIVTREGTDKDNLAYTLCQAAGFDYDKVSSRVRTREDFLEPRQFIHYVLVNHFEYGYDAAGKSAGSFDHSTVAHSLKAVDQLLGTSKSYRMWFHEKIEAIEPIRKEFAKAELKVIDNLPMDEQTINKLYNTARNFLKSKHFSKSSRLDNLVNFVRYVESINNNNQ
jgi:hypothetical protein